MHIEILDIGTDQMPTMVIACRFAILVAGEHAIGTCWQVEDVYRPNTLTVHCWFLAIDTDADISQAGFDLDECRVMIVRNGKLDALRNGAAARWGLWAWRFGLWAEG